MKGYARRGAGARLVELKEEMQSIYTAFPDLREMRGRGSLGRETQVGNGAAPKSKRRRRRMSAAQRKAVSARMRKYWAARRKAKTT